MSYYTHYVTAMFIHTFCAH